MKSAEVGISEVAVLVLVFVMGSSEALISTSSLVRVRAPSADGVFNAMSNSSLLSNAIVSGSESKPSIGVVADEVDSSSGRDGACRELRFSGSLADGRAAVSSGEKGGAMQPKGSSKNTSACNAAV